MGMGLINIPVDPIKKSGGIGGTFARIGGGLMAAAGALIPGAQPLVPLGALVAGAGSATLDAADPAKVTGGGKPQPVAPSELAAKSRLNSDPSAQVAQLNESLSALQQHGDEKLKMTVEPYLVSARDKLIGRMG